MPVPYAKTLPSLLLANAEKHPGRTALREKEFGIWQSYSWDEYLQKTVMFAAGLQELGFHPGDILVIIGDNRPEAVWGQLAIQSLGGVSLGLYQDSPADEIAYVFELSEAKMVMAEDQEQVDKILSISSRLPALKYIVYHDPKGLSSYEIEGLMDFDSVCDLGRSGIPDFCERVQNLRPDDTATIVTTSGTTGRPKLAMLSHANLLSMAWNLGQVDPKYTTDEFVSFLPLAWIGEQMMAIASALLFGFCVNFPEEPDTVWENVREIGPNLIFSPPRVWENLAASVRVRIMETSRIKRFFYQLFIPLGLRYADAVLSGSHPGRWTTLGYKVGDWGLFRALRDRLGFSRIRSASTGGAALGPDTFRFFHAIGVNLKQIYGQTEIAGISCIHREGLIDFDTVGEPIPETEIIISEKGEILSKSPAVFQGYFKDRKSTEQDLEQGWLRSGDAGYFKENGQLVVIDRLKDVMQLVDGTNFSPQFMENKLKFSPYIREAVILGSDRKYIAAIICIDQDIVGRWAESRQITYTTYQDLSAKPEVYDLIAHEIHSINETLPEKNRIHRFALLFKELDPDDGELTRTRKVRRAVVGERYEDLIQSLYSEEDSTQLTARITYQDGRVREMSGPISIRDLSPQTG